jgi:hypothetical protein
MKPRWAGMMQRSSKHEPSRTRSPVMGLSDAEECRSQEGRRGQITSAKIAAWYDNFSNCHGCHASLLAWCSRSNATVPNSALLKCASCASMCSPVIAQV